MDSISSPAAMIRSFFIAFFRFCWTFILWMHRCAVFHKSGRNFPGEFVLRTKDGKIFFTGQPPRFSPAAGEGSGAGREIGKIGKNFPYIVKSASVWCGNFALSKRGTEKGTAGRDVRVSGPGVAAGTGTAGR